MLRLRFLGAPGRNALGTGALLALASGAGAAPATPAAAPDTAVYVTEPIVVTAVRPSAAFTLVTDPRNPRQPVPASDGADYLRTIPGFASIRYGGTNADPVLRGLQGSRLNVLSDGACMLGACPARMDAPTSYIAPENFDRLVVVKGPQTVSWGPGASAGTIQFERLAPDLGAGETSIEPAPSPDGRYLAYVDSRRTPNNGAEVRNELFLADLKTGRRRRIAALVEAEFVPWSRDGRHVYFANGDDGPPYSVRVVDADRVFGRR
jgi:iron complex outermembrane receptor protein